MVLVYPRQEQVHDARLVKIDAEDPRGSTNKCLSVCLRLCVFELCLESDYLGLLLAPCGIKLHRAVGFRQGVPNGRVPLLDKGTVDRKKKKRDEK